LWLETEIMLKFVRQTAAVLFIAAAVAAAAPALSQQPAQQPAPPSPAALTVAKELLVALGSDKQLEAMVPMMMQNMRKIMGQQKPGAQKELDEAFTALEAKFGARRNELIDEVARTYAIMVPVEDMKAMTAFFTSPAGKRFVAQQPELMRQSMVVGQRWGEKLGREVEAELQQELQKRGVKP
jgi:uncharacterized protein